MQRADAKAVLEAGYAARRAGDVDGVMACFHADATFQLVADFDFGAMALPVRGASDLRIAIWQLCATWDWAEMPVADLVIDAEADPVRAAVRSAGTMIHRPSGKRFPLDVLHLHTIRDGKIFELREYVDTYKISRLGV